MGLSDTEIPLRDLFSKAAERSVDQIREVINQKASVKYEISTDNIIDFLLKAMNNKKALKEFTELHLLLRKFIEQEA